MSTFSTNQLIGKTEAEALKEIADAGLIVRMRTQGDRVTGDFLGNRVNLYIKDNKVIKANLG